MLRLCATSHLRSYTWGNVRRDQGSGPGVSLLSELARRAKDAGRLRPEFVLDDLLTVGFA